MDYRLTRSKLMIFGSCFKIYSSSLPFKCFDQDGVEYRVNVYSLAEHEGMVVESEACHVKVPHILPIIVINVLEMKKQAFREYENAEFFEEGRGQAVINLVSPKEIRSGSAR